jgi:adenine-specific DNA-methyltransferase
VSFYPTSSASHNQFSVEAFALYYSDRGSTLFASLDQLRRDVSAEMDAETKGKLGQFLTPSSVAAFMASLFTDSGSQPVRLLDAGAGVGALTTAFIKEWERRNTHCKISITTYEVDDKLRAHLATVLAEHATEYEIRDTDFIEDSTHRLFFGVGAEYTHAILNPPYKKINTKSEHRLQLRTLGIETVNLYSAFVAIAIKALVPGGELVAIIPRSFCNGPYYRPFRDIILRETSIMRMHLFGARDKAFKEDAVLQENIIIHLVKGGEQGDVKISTSTDDSFSDLLVRSFPFEQIVFPSDRERFFHVPTSAEPTLLEHSDAFSTSLSELGIEVSTGPVVDFRMRADIQQMPVPGTVPLLYPGHFTDTGVQWPKPDGKKPNAIRYDDRTAKWFFPVGHYAVVRRFSAKEERRRLYAGYVSPEPFSAYQALGFENHLNVFHRGKRGIDELLAKGLTAFFNSTAADTYFRRFNGHTQVNATDLRAMRYPDLQTLTALGRKLRAASLSDQETVDSALLSLV